MGFDGNNQGESMNVYKCEKCGSHHTSKECPDQEKELPTHIRQRLYANKVTKIQYVSSSNTTNVFWVDAKKNEKISSFEGKIELKTVHDALVFLYKKGILNPEKEWNLVC